MLIKRRAGWELPEIQATPESVFLNRRQLMAAGAGLIAGAALPGIAAAEAPDPTLDLYPAKRNETYKLDVPLTKAEDAANYNNFYEFGMSKDIVDASHRLATRPWSIEVDGMVDKPFEIGFDDLVRKLPLEERLSAYFHFHGLRGGLLMRMGRNEEARVAFDRAIALANTPAEAAHIRMHIDRLVRESAGTVPAPVTG